MLKVTPPVIAHRGASALAPENTLAAFEKAAALGIKWIECDVVQAACGEPVIFHDDLLDRTTNGTGPVFTHPYSHLKLLDAGGWFNPAFLNERIPTLKELLHFLATRQMNANIEIKALPGQEAEQVKNVMEIMQPYLDSSENTFLFSSFSLEALKCIRQFYPQVLVGLLLHEWLPDWQEICAWLHPVSIHVNDEIITQNTAEIIKAMNKQLFCYTVNHPARAQMLFSWGVDAVFTDVPDIIIASLT